MDPELNKVEASLAHKKLLLAKAKYYKALATSMEEEALSLEDLKNSIKYIQGQIMNYLDKFMFYRNLLCKSINNQEFPKTVTPEFLLSCKFPFYSLLDLVEILEFLKSTIFNLYASLEEICRVVGHNYEYMETDQLFDFSGLETTFTNQDIYYCTTCGSLILKEHDEEKSSNLTNNEKNILKNLRGLKANPFFELPFLVVREENADRELQKGLII